MVQKNSTIARALVVLGSVALTLTFAGCSVSNTDILKSSPDDVANRISELFKNGDGEGLCEIEKVTNDMSCDSLLSSEGLDSKPAPKLETDGVSTNKYTFELDSGEQGRFTYVLEAIKDAADSNHWIYKTYWLGGQPNIVLPFGGSLNGTLLAADDYHFAMPGKLKGTLELNADSNNWLDVKVGSVGFTALGEQELTTETLKICNEELDAKPNFDNLSFSDHGFGNFTRSVTHSSSVIVTKKCQVENLHWSDGHVTSNYTFEREFKGHPQFYTPGTFTQSRTGVVKWDVSKNGDWGVAKHAIPKTPDFFTNDAYWNLH